MAAAKTKKIKKVTTIPEASVKIEVEESEEATEEVEEVVEEKEETEETPSESEEKEETEEKETTVDDSEEEKTEVENFDDENSGYFTWKKVLLFIAIATITGIVIVTGFLIFTGDYNLSFTKSEKSEKIIEVAEETPTPTPDEVDKSAYDIEVQNGSGIAGEAASVQETLEDAGFSVSGIGNAETADYTDTQILYAKDVDEAYLDELQATLEERGPVELEEADSDQTEDVVVIVGSELTEAQATPTPDLE